MDQLAPFKPGDEDIRDWLDRFELWYHLSKKEATEQADWCRLLICKEADSSLHLVKDKQPYEAVRVTLIKELGETKQREAAARKLAGLMRETLTCSELASQAKYLAQATFSGAPEVIIEQQALDAFLRALPVALRREVMHVEKKMLQEACDEAICQEALAEDKIGKEKAVKVVQKEDNAVMAVQPGTPVVVQLLYRQPVQRRTLLRKRRIPLRHVPRVSFRRRLIPLWHVPRTSLRRRRILLRRVHRALLRK